MSGEVEGYSNWNEDRRNPWLHLDNPAYREYQLIPKTYADKDTAVRLEELADSMSEEFNPGLLNAAASAYQEASIARSDLDTESRMTLFSKAKLSWEASLRNESYLCDKIPEQSDYIEGCRVAVNLACLPMVKGLILGDVKAGAMAESIHNLLQISDISQVQRNLAVKGSRMDAAAHHVGLEHEINTLLVFLYHQDPRFIALPSTERAGSGYFNKEQTHDINVISQHFGEVRSILPVEVKARPSRKDRLRYKALIIRGRMHLSAPSVGDPAITKEVFRRCFNGESSEGDEAFMGSIVQTVSQLTSDYKKRGKYKPFYSKGSKMSYYNPESVLGDLPQKTKV